MNSKRTRINGFRPLLLVSAVGMACQTVMAQSVAELSATPFASRPLHLENTSVNSEIPGVKPNVLLFIDDSGSMLAGVPGSGPPGEELSRIAVVRNALNRVLDVYQDQIRWNIFTLWGTENNPRNMNIRHPFMTAAEMRPLVNNIRDHGWTPTTWRYFDTVRILKEGIQYRCQKNYIVLLSDGDANRGSDDSTAGLPPFQPWEKALYGSFTNPQNNRGNSNFDWDRNRWFWIQNGQYTDSNKKPYFTYINGLDNGIARFSHILAKADLRTDDEHGKDAEGGYWDYNDTDPDPVMRNTLFPKQSIGTFTIGFQDGLRAAGRGYLVDAATCEYSTNEANKLNNCWFPVTTASDVSNAFDSILKKIHNENQSINPSSSYSASTPAVTGSTIAELAATLTLDTGIWSSQLLFAKFNEGTLGKDTQSANYKNRKVIVNNGTDAPYWLNPSTPAARKADFGIADNAEFTLGFVPWLIRHPTINDTAIENQVNTGVPKENRTVSQYRIRAAEADSPARQMADVIGAPVVAMGSVSDDDKKQKYVVTAANDGMAYIFAYDKTAKAYDLTLNYLPAGMQRESRLPPDNPASITVGKTVRATAEANYGKNDLTNPHVYLNNGGLSWVRTPKTGGRNQQDILLGTMGQGGRGAYALTIAGKKRADRSGDAAAGLDTASGSWLTEVPLWETEKSRDNMLGYTISTGVIGQVATRWKTGSGTSGSAGSPDVNEGVHLYAFIANGYQSGNAEVPYDASPTLYVYDMMGQEFGRKINRDSTSVANGNTPGKLVRKISVRGKPGALATPTLVDTNLDGLVDFAYAGDQYGDMYRFDLRGAPSQWSAAKLYDGIEDQPITAAPAVYKVDNQGEKYVVVFGTGSDIYDEDRKDRKRQVIMGVHDDLTKVPELVTHGGSEIVQQEMEEITNPLYASNKALPEKIRVFSKVNPFEGTHRAWRIELAEAQGTGENITTSERVVTKPQVLTRTAFITTRIYDFKKTEGSLPKGVDPEQTCFRKISETQTGGNSWQMAIDVVTGGGPLAGANSSTAKGAYFEFSDTKVDDGSGGGSGGGGAGGGSGTPGGGSGNGSGTPNRVVAAGFSYGALASAPALVDTNSSSSVTFQTNAQGELGYHGEIVGPFGSDPSNPDNAGDGGERNPLRDLKKDCIPSKSKLSLLVATGGENTGSGHNNVQTKLVGPPCFESEGLIRIDWRQVPL